MCVVCVLCVVCGVCVSVWCVCCVVCERVVRGVLCVSVCEREREVLWVTRTSAHSVDTETLVYILMFIFMSLYFSLTHTHTPSLSKCVCTGNSLFIFSLCAKHTFARLH